MSESPTTLYLASHPSAVAQLQALETATNSEVPPPPPPSVIPELRALADDLETAKNAKAHLANELAAAHATIESLRTKLRRQSATASHLAASEARLSAQLDHSLLVTNHCKRCTISAHDPDPYTPFDLDIHLEELPHPWPSSSLLSGAPRYIAWVPVPLYPFPIRGKYGFSIGETRVSQSLAIPSISIPRISDPSDPSHYNLSPFCISGYASISIAKGDPDTHLAYLDSLASRDNSISQSLPSDHPSDSSSPPFIPSQATPSPTPDSRVPYNPSPRP